MQSQAVSDTYKQTTIPRGAENHSGHGGLDDDIKPFQLLRLVRDVGHQIGLTGGDVQHLDYLISHTKEIDWTAGERPVVYKSVCKMARERGISERQIHNREARLHALGCLVWNDMGNFRRMGGRDRSGRLAFAYGVDLSPLAARYQEFVALKAQHVEDLAAFDTARRRISSIRRRVLVKITLAQESELDVAGVVERFAELPRVHARTSADTLEVILATISALETALDEALAETRQNCGLNQKTSDQSEQNFRHIQPTNNPQSSKDDTCNQPAGDDREEGSQGPDDRGTVYTGIERLYLWQIMKAASDDFSCQIVPTGRAVRISDVVDAAGRHCHPLGIHKSAWGDACSVMGRTAAAVAVIIIDRNMDHPETPIINPGGVLRALTARAQAGDLHLHKSVFGILDRDTRGDKKC